MKPAVKTQESSRPITHAEKLLREVDDIVTTMTSLAAVAHATRCCPASEMSGERQFNYEHVFKAILRVSYVYDDAMQACLDHAIGVTSELETSPNTRNIEQ